MNTNAVFVMVLALLLVSCGQPLAPPTPLAAPSRAQGTTTRGEVVPQKGELPPHPEVTSEEHERLLRGTEVEDQNAVDNNPPGPPGIPPVPGPKTNVVAPNASGSDQPAR